MPRRSAADREIPRFELVKSMPLDLPAPPAHLSEPTQQWWRAIVTKPLASDRLYDTSHVLRTRTPNSKT
jgi:hypothetical protein